MALTLQTRAFCPTKPRAVRCAAVGQVHHYAPPFLSTPAAPTEAVSRLAYTHLPKPFLVVSAPFELVGDMMEKGKGDDPDVKIIEEQKKIRQTVDDIEKKAGRDWDKYPQRYFDRVDQQK